MNAFWTKDLEFLPGVGVMLYGATILYVSAKIGIHGLPILALLLVVSIMIDALRWWVIHEEKVMNAGAFVISISLAFSRFLSFGFHKFDFYTVVGSVLIFLSYLLIRNNISWISNYLITGVISFVAFGLLLISISSIWTKHSNYIVNTLILIISCILLSMSQRADSRKQDNFLSDDEDYFMIN